MKASELRIRNWIKGYHDPEDLDQVTAEHFSTVDPDGEIDGDGIPLTAEILEKAGWFAIEKGKKYINNERGVITVSFDELGLVMYQIGDMNFTTVHYLHQLQNLYYALTGIELQIDLSK